MKEQAKQTSQVSAHNQHTTGQPFFSFEKPGVVQKKEDSFFNNNVASSQLFNDTGTTDTTETFAAYNVQHVPPPRQSNVASSVIQAKKQLPDDQLLSERETVPAGKQQVKEKATAPVQLKTKSAQRNVTASSKKKEIPTDFGTFISTDFSIAPKGYGVDIDLAFKPDEHKVNATKIAMTQAGKAIDNDHHVTKHPTWRSRMVGSGLNQGYGIDQKVTINSPLYTQETSLGAGEEIENTPNTPATSKYQEIGWCYYEKPGDPKKKQQDAVLTDGPLVSKKVGNGVRFETTALAIAGADKGIYYGSVKWGFDIGGTEDEPIVIPNDIELGSKNATTSVFAEAAEQFNKGKTQGTLQVIKGSAADVLVWGNAPGIDPRRKMLAGGTKLKQIPTEHDERHLGAAAIKANVLEGDDEGAKIDIRMVDIEDTLDGGPNKKLQIPAPDKTKASDRERANKFSSGSTKNTPGHGTVQKKEAPFFAANSTSQFFKNTGTALQAKADSTPTIANSTAMPDTLKSNAEALSGIDMSDVKVQYNSPQPSALNALAYTQGNEIHLGPGQEQHLPHEAWHIVQQKQGRVAQGSTQTKGHTVNDNPALEQEADQMGGQLTGNNIISPELLKKAWSEKR